MELTMWHSVSLTSSLSVSTWTFAWTREVLHLIQSAMDKTVIDKAIDQALAESHEQGIHGKETTPFLLARVAELTGGDSLESNIQLVLNNARVAAKTAVALCK